MLVFVKMVQIKIPFERTMKCQKSVMATDYHKKIKRGWFFNKIVTRSMWILQNSDQYRENYNFYTSFSINCPILPGKIRRWLIFISEYTRILHACQYQSMGVCSTHFHSYLSTHWIDTSITVIYLYYMGTYTVYGQIFCE